MLRWIEKLNEGSLARRTLMHVAIFVLGSASVVALASAVLVTTAKALLPSHDAMEAAAETAKPGADGDAEASAPEAAAGTAGGSGGPKAYAQLLGARREGLGVQ